MTYQLPSFYDSVNLVTRPMDSTAQLPPAQVPVSARGGNTVQNLADGLYVGTVLPQPVVYVNGSSGADAPTSGAKATPYKTLDYALAQAIANSTNTQLTSPVTIALQCGQTFACTNTIPVYAGALVTLTFYGDSQYGDFNSPPVGTGANPAQMSDLVRPIIVPVVGNVNSQWVMAGFNMWGGSIKLLGVQLNLPAAPASPSITLYSQYADFVRSMNYATPGYLNFEGSVANITDTNAYWGLCGVFARSTALTLTQFGSQFRVNNTLLQDGTATTAQLQARQYFVKFYADYAGNNQQSMVLSGSSSNTSTGSGILNLTWADTEALSVASGKTNQATFPIMFNLNYGFRNYVYGLLNDQQQRPLNIQSSRLF
jgi:hypothetical protein